MKKEKLELLLNKVIEFVQPDVANFKGFLYNDGKKYYIKVIEITLGSLSFNEKYYLKDGDEKFLIVAEHPKLMRVSKNSWHYRLLKYVLRSNAPTPKDMQNGCPYFWLLIFSILVVPFILIAKSVYWVVMLFPKALFWILEQMVNDWIASLDDEAAYDMYWGGGNSVMPKTAKIYFKQSDDQFFEFFLSKKYKDISMDDPNYKEKRKEIQGKWEIWRADLDEKRTAQRAAQSEREAELRMKRYEQEKKRAEVKANWDAKMQPIRDGFKKFGASLKKTFTVERGRVNMIIKRTKQFVGAIVTLVILAATFVAVNYISLALMVAADWCIAHWEIFLGIGIAAVVIGIGYLFYVLIVSWLQGVVNKYNRGKKVWYIEPFIYVVFYPLKYVAMAVAFIAINIIWIPIKFIFYTLLWKGLVLLGTFLWGIIRAFGNGIAGSSGVFGEYFGASYSDYCPGIEWTDFDEEDN